MVSRVRLVVFVWIAALSCRRDPSHLDEIQKMAYAVKPAVVRISAYATAQFFYSPKSIDIVWRPSSAGPDRLKPELRTRVHTDADPVEIHLTL